VYYEPSGTGAKVNTGLSALPCSLYSVLMFISAPIEVEMQESEGRVKVSAAFAWDGTRDEIERILDFHFDTGFGEQTHGRAWYTRRHRNCYRVEASDGHLYDIYLDRAGGKREWVLYQRVEDE
jgi:hypothetical protein